MRIMLVVVGLALLASLQSCSEDDDPQFRIRNDRPTKANVQIKTTGGNTININDVEQGVLTPYQSAAPGGIEATAVIQGESVSPTLGFAAFTDETYTIIVTNSTPPTLSYSSP